MNRDVRLSSITQMRKKYNCIIGLSDHTNNCLSSYGAIALGACIIEKHFVDKKSRVGPDINSSIDESQLAELIKGCNSIFEQMKGDKNQIASKEKITKKFAFASIVSSKDIKKGEKFSYKNLHLKRPGTGELKFKDMKNILGKQSLKNIIKNIQIKKMDSKIKDKTIILFGCTGILGSEFLEFLYSRGAKLILADLKSKNLNTMKKYPAAKFYKCD